jgi:hypothetical protein
MVPLNYDDHGRFFFHYTTREAAFEHIIPSRTIRLSPYALMRDPLEARAEVGAAYAGPPDQAEHQDITRAYFDAVRVMQEARWQYKLLSFTVDEEDDDMDQFDRVFGAGWTRARMWEHYAETHQGVCLVFHREAFEATALRQLSSRSPGSLAGPVRYTRAGLAETPAISLGGLAAGADGTRLAREHLNNLAKDLFFLKLLDWKSEHEYRFMEPGQDDNYSSIQLEDTLAGVILGHRFPRWQVASALTICKDEGIDLSQVNWLMSRPSLGRWADPAARQSR